MPDAVHARCVRGARAVRLLPQSMPVCCYCDGMLLYRPDGGGGWQFLKVGAPPDDCTIICGVT